MSENNRLQVALNERHARELREADEALSSAFELTSEGELLLSVAVLQQLLIDKKMTLSFLKSVLFAFNQQHRQQRVKNAMKEMVANYEEALTNEEITPVFHERVTEFEKFLLVKETDIFIDFRFMSKFLERYSHQIINDILKKILRQPNPTETFQELRDILKLLEEDKALVLITPDDTLVLRTRTVAEKDLRDFNVWGLSKKKAAVAFEPHGQGTHFFCSFDDWVYVSGDDWPKVGDNFLVGIFILFGHIVVVK